jgi:NAD(P)-dependent dehydrogenase (short-subunit alcohol dehydrogenase family)
MNDDIQDTIAVVTGANRGIGRAFVEAFVERGAAKVYAAVRTPDSAAPLVGKYGARVVPLYVDLADPPSIAALAAQAKDARIVVNNAGVLGSSSPLGERAIEMLEYEMNINVYGLIRMAQAFAPVLKANGGGVFVQLNSVASLKSFPDFATYCASKAAAHSLTQSLREMLGAQGTRVLSVHPGPIATDMADAAGVGSLAEPPSQVPQAVFEALKTGSFHVYTDTMAKRVGAAYRSFAESVVEARLL